jgi:hypothetical protein
VLLAGGVLMGRAPLAHPNRVTGGGTQPG